MKKYIPIEKSKLTERQIKSIRLKLLPTKQVQKFISECELPYSSFYKAMNGKPIKKSHVIKIISTLKNY